MIIYNVTIKVENNIHEAWLSWMREEHIAEVVATGCFTHAHFLRLIEIDDAEGPTYAVQYHAESKALYNKYIEQFADGIRQKAFAKWGNGFIAFRSVLEKLR